MDELLFKLETQTAVALSLCADGKALPTALNGARHAGIAQLCDLIQHGILISEAQLERIRAIEKGGASILACIREMREGLRENLRVAARQRSFAKCIESVLDLPHPPELLTDATS